MIEPLPKPLRHYLAQFGLGAIAVSSSGQIQVVGVDRLARPGTAALWWTKDRAAAYVVTRAIGAHVPPSLEAAVAELKAAAARCDIVLSEHDAVLARARAALDQLDKKLETARSAGQLQFFNRAYKQYRLDCQQRGMGAMPYNIALTKLRRLLAGAAAGASIEGVVERVLGER